MGSELKKISTTSTKEQILTTCLPKIESGLRADERILWVDTPSNKLLALDTLYKGLLWWSVFPMIVPMTEQILYCSILMMVALGYLDYKGRRNSAIYVLTNERALFNKLNRKLEMKQTEFDLRNLRRVRKTPFTRTIKLKFGENFRTKFLKLPYIDSVDEPMRILNARLVES